MSTGMETSRTLSDYGGILRRRVKLLLTIIPAALLLAIVYAYSLPTLYQSTATMMLEGAAISGDMVQTTAAPAAAQQVELVQRSVMTRARVMELLAAADPYPGLEATPEQKADEIIANTSFEPVNPVTFEPMPISPAFSIHYLNPNPQLAQTVARGIAELFVAQSRQTRQDQARETRVFLESRVKEIDGQVRQVESRMSEFKQRHGDALPENRLRNETALDRTQRDLDSAEAQVRLYEQQEQLLKLQLNQINPMLVASTGDAFTQVAAVRAELAAAQQRYTPDHPDIKRLQRVLQSLIEQGKSSQASGVTPDNPDYLRVQAELSTVRSNLSAQRSVAARARAQMADYGRRMVSSPVVERDYVALERERDALQAQLRELQGKLGSAEIAQSLETENRGERYTLLKASNLPSKPASPNRLGIIVLGLVLGGGLAAGLAVMREGADPSIRDRRDITALGSLPIIGTIPLMPNEEDRQRGRRGWMATAAAYAAGIVVVAIVILRAH
jgi:polysaccharide biosynthesis transport protein